jgi:hypothetical protein
MNKSNVKRRGGTRCVPEIGERFGRWEVIRLLGVLRTQKGVPKTHVLAKCDCGAEKVFAYSTIRLGKTLSCGCFRREKIRQMALEREQRHGLSKHPLYQIWRGMKGRCLNKRDKAYFNWGGRGITVCDEWKDDFQAFYDFALNNGWALGLITDRRDNNKGYSPDNIRFVTPAISMRNTQRTRAVSFDGKTMCVTDWAAEFNITPQSVFERIQKHGAEKAMEYYHNKNKE